MGRRWRLPLKKRECVRMPGIIEIQRKEVQGIGSCPWRCGENPLIGKKNYRHRPLFILLRTDAKGVAYAWNSAHARSWRCPMSSTERDITPLLLQNRWTAWGAISVKRCALNSQFFVKIQRINSIDATPPALILLRVSATQSENWCYEEALKRRHWNSQR